MCWHQTDTCYSVQVKASTQCCATAVTHRCDTFLRHLIPLPWGSGTTSHGLLPSLSCLSVHLFISVHFFPLSFFFISLSVVWLFSSYLYALFYFCIHSKGTHFMLHCHWAFTILTMAYITKISTNIDYILNFFILFYRVYTTVKHVGKIIMRSKLE